MSAGEEADGWERYPLFSRNVSLNSFCSLTNRVRDEKQTWELCLYHAGCLHFFISQLEIQSGAVCPFAFKEESIESTRCTFENTLHSCSSERCEEVEIFKHPPPHTHRESLWCKVPEESPAVVSGDIMQLSWGQGEWVWGDRFLSPKSPPLMISPHREIRCFLCFVLISSPSRSSVWTEKKKKEQLLRQGWVGLLAEPSTERGTVTGSSVWFLDQFVRPLSFILMEQNYRLKTKAINNDNKQHKPGHRVCFSLPTTPAWITAQSEVETAREGELVVASLNRCLRKET